MTAADVRGPSFGGRFPISGSLSHERTHFMLVDSVIEEPIEEPIEESIETTAAACMIALLPAIGAACLPATPVGGRRRPSALPGGQDILRCEHDVQADVLGEAGS